VFGRKFPLDLTLLAGKKAKKSKGKTVNLNDFLATDNGPTPGQAVVMAPRKISSWADEVDDDIDCKYTHNCVCFNQL
jgi:hypothetical protein